MDNMTTTHQDSNLPVRLSLRQLVKDETKRNAFLRAFKRITELPPDNPNSYWAIAGYHGEPFAKRMVPGNPKEVWGGYCQHNNVLFPTWHRRYLLRLEQALQTVCEDVMLPYWDETSDEALQYGLPEILTADTLPIDGKFVKNPLKSFTFPEGICCGEGDLEYRKAKGYETVRYPFSGIESPAKDKAIAAKHNGEVLKSKTDTVKALNHNIIDWLFGTKKLPGIKDHYASCLDASTYNAFSNITSAKVSYETALEEPHDSIHLAVGGYTSEGGQSFGKIQGANGDMGENETAAFDPVFFLHHCNVDRMFWIWQRRWGQTDSLDIEETDPVDPGTIPAKGQGPTPFQEPYQRLSMDTVLHPFQLPIGLPATSKDCVNIEKLGYRYSPGSFEDQASPTTKVVNTHIHKVSSLDDVTRIMKQEIKSSKERSLTAVGPEKLRVIFDISDIQEKESARPLQSGTGNWQFYISYFIKVHSINRDLYPGSFLVRAFYQSPKNMIGESAILDRWNAERCPNCQQHRVIDVVFDVSKVKMPMRPKIKDISVKAIFFDPKLGKHVEREIKAEKIYEGDEENMQPSLSFVAVYTREMIGY
eukprot:Seg1152.4 transcript_id=Seg1152.4/GoldUCD/mRNA.D3Y31 product=Tyrosinase protein_id=Seg1152.4/GoldUCD/D3Y31